MDILKLHDKYEEDDVEDTYKDFGQCNTHVVITLRPELYKKRARSQYQTTYHNVETLLDIYTDSYILVAELTNDSNIHYHCLVEWAKHMPEAKHRFIDVCKLSRVLGKPFINKKTIPNKAEWHRTYEYICKEIQITNRIINYNPKHEELETIKQVIVKHTTTKQDHNNELLDVIRGQVEP